MKNSFFTKYHINKNRKIDFFVDFVSIILALLYRLLLGNFVLSALITSVGILGILDTLDYPISSHRLIKNLQFFG
ncbi:hypothetical protein ABZU07_01190 [Lactobacillus jensenii]|jgi:hypothetical protein|uniref:hypothetical protein n=1 Tax=Lactobacillus jensenii TaxID=109790 RepID=UPI0001A43EB2|nr:hypothetical protein LBJG_00658 [Lactobacillus jensenii 1153]PLA44681.1 hypothetical protein CYJ90_03025 [Lactobacillus jensenii]